MDRLTKLRRSWNMSRIRSTDTQPEIILRKYLHKSGFRYRVRYKLTGKPDLVFPKNKIAIFVHGCFWHQHGCNNSVIPKTNTSFWLKKLINNVARDKFVLKELRRKKWKVKKVWECQLETNQKEIFDRIETFLQTNGVGLDVEKHSLKNKIQ